MATKTATVQSGQVTGTHTNFPAFIDPADVGITTQAELDSVRVYTDAGLTTEIARECVSLNEMHVKIPSMTSSTQLWVDYDGIRADYAVSATYGRNAVWSDYVGVWHMQNIGATALDSTGNGNNPTNNNTVGQTTGPVGDAVSLVRSNAEYLGGSDIADVSTGVTISGWIKFTTTTLTYLIQKGDRDSDNNYRIEVGSNGGFYRKVNGTMRNLTITQAWSTGVDYMIHAVQNTSSGGGKFYIDGALKKSDSFNGNLTPNNQEFTIGARYNGASGSVTPQDFFNGSIDEVRVRSQGENANWVTTEYNNQNDNSAFWGTWTDAGGGPTANNSARRMLLMQM